MFEQTTMKYKDVVALWNSIYEAGGKKGTKFAYGVIKTRQSIEPVINELMKLQVPPKEYVEYDNKRSKLCVEYSDKDENNKPKTTGNNYIIAEDRKPEFEEKMKGLNEEYAEVQKAFLKQIGDYNEKLNEEVKVHLHKIPLSQFPADMTTEELERFLPLVLDDSPTVH